MQINKIFVFSLPLPLSLSRSLTFCFDHQNSMVSLHLIKKKNEKISWMLWECSLTTAASVRLSLCTILTLFVYVKFVYVSLSSFYSTLISIISMDFYLYARMSLFMFSLFFSSSSVLSMRFFLLVCSLQNIFNLSIVYRFVYCYWQLKYPPFKHRKFFIWKDFFFLFFDCNDDFKVFWIWIFCFFRTKLGFDAHTHTYMHVCHQFNVKKIHNRL